MKRWIAILSVLSTAGAGALFVPSNAAAAPPKKKPESAPSVPAGPSCKLLTTEAPRGGRLEVEGSGFGKAPLVRIGGKVTRTIERTDNRIAVQIPANSDGGPVIVVVGKLQAACGTLTIIGRD
jgi:IPT/TIG domain